MRSLGRNSSPPRPISRPGSGTGHKPDRRDARTFFSFFVESESRINNIWRNLAGIPILFSQFTVACYHRDPSSPSPSSTQHSTGETREKSTYFQCAARTLTPLSKQWHPATNQQIGLKGQQGHKVCADSSDVLLFPRCRQGHILDRGMVTSQSPGFLALYPAV